MIVRTINDNNSINLSYYPNKCNIYKKNYALNTESKQKNIAAVTKINLSNLSFLRLALTGIVIVLGGSFNFGYQISLINPLADVLQEFLEHGIRK